MTTTRAAALNHPPRPKSPLRQKSRRLHPSRPAVLVRRPAARRISLLRAAARPTSLPADRPVLPPAAAPARSRPVDLLPAVPAEAQR